MQHIESRKNPIVQMARSLHRRKGRVETGLHLAEGEKLLGEAAASGLTIETLFVVEGYGGALPAANHAYTVTRSVLEAISTTVMPHGVCGMVETPRITDVPEHFSPGMLVALNRLQDPGNLGTIVRTADAMGAQGIILGEGCVDPFSPKSLRAAMGSTYHVPLYAGDLKAALQRLQDDGVCCICGHLQGKEGLPYFTDRCVIVIGNEGNGVDEDIAALCARVRLPMYGRTESLNASMAAGILMYEAAKWMREHNL